MQDVTIEITNETKGKLPSLPFLELKNAILGKKYSLSIAYVSPAKMKKMNSTTRGKDYATDILSFELSKTSGEIILCPKIIEKKAPDFGMTIKKYNLFIVIHGMLHLKGYAHGSRMERAETLFLRRFS